MSLGAMRHMADAGQGNQAGAGSVARDRCGMGGSDDGVAIAGDGDAGCDPRAIFAKDGLVDELKKALANRVLSAELDDQLDGEAAAGKANRRNGYSKKTVLGESSKLELRIPRDREGTFDPKLIAKYQRRFPGFDEKIISMHARGMSVREIQGHLLEIYGLDVSPHLISTVTDAVLETVASGRTGRWRRAIRWSFSTRCG